MPAPNILEYLFGTVDIQKSKWKVPWSLLVSVHFTSPVELPKLSFLNFSFPLPMAFFIPCIYNTHTYRQREISLSIYNPILVKKYHNSFFLSKLKPYTVSFQNSLQWLPFLPLFKLNTFRSLTSQVFSLSYSFLLILVLPQDRVLL